MVVAFGQDSMKASANIVRDLSLAYRLLILKYYGEKAEEYQGAEETPRILDLGIEPLEITCFYTNNMDPSLLLRVI